MAVTLRSTKGSALTHAEMDANFQSLDDKSSGVIPITPDINGGTIDNTVIGGTTPNAGTFTYLTASQPTVVSVNSTSDALRVTQTGSGNALVVEDSTNPDASPFVVNATGQVGLGSTPYSNAALTVARNETGATSGYGVISWGTIQSDVTVGYEGYRSQPSLAASLSLTSLIHYRAMQGTIGSGSSITNQYGFYVGSTIVDATNNYAFYAGIPSDTGQWNFYAGGTASNYFAGKVGIGSSSLSDIFVHISGDITGSTNAMGVNNVQTVKSDVTTTATCFRTAASTEAASFTLTTLNHYQATQATIGSGSTVLQTRLVIEQKQP